MCQIEVTNSKAPASLIQEHSDNFRQVALPEQIGGSDAVQAKFIRNVLDILGVYHSILFIGSRDGVEFIRYIACRQFPRVLAHSQILLALLLGLLVYLFWIHPDYQLQYYIGSIAPVVTCLDSSIINYHYSSMKSVLRIVGRFLFILLLLTSAIMKVKQPKTYTKDIIKGYETIRSLHPLISDYTPTVNSLNAHIPPEILVRVIAGLQAMMALLIMLGESLGGLLFFVYLAIYGIGTHAPMVMEAIAKQKINNVFAVFSTIYPLIMLLGFSLVFYGVQPVRKAAFKA